jgi:hypothetical protein
VLVRGDGGCLNWGQKARHATEPIWEHRAVEVGLHGRHGMLGIKISVVEAIGQDDQIWRKPVTTNVTALPDKLRPPGC